MAACSPSARAAPSSSAWATAAARAIRGNRAQNRNSLLGKILRIDVDQRPALRHPGDQPVRARRRPARRSSRSGFRNPWRFSFDRLTGQLYVGDVGQSAVEEIDIVARGFNYGWRLMEGDRCFEPAVGCNDQDLKLPVATYAQTGGRCSITGGYVYRGLGIPALYGTYVYGDFCTGEIFGLAGGQTTVLLDTDLSIASFGENRAGELYVVDLQGTIHAIVAAAMRSLMSKALAPAMRHATFRYRLSA